MFVHTVFFWLKNKSSEADRKQLRAGLESLQSIASIRHAWIGEPASTRRSVIDHSYDYAITFVFNDLQGHDLYQDDPVHLKFVENCGTLWNRVQVYDTVTS